VIALAVIVGSIGWIAARGLSNSLVYYQTPTELLGRGATAVGDRVRLGGYVVPGTVHEEDKPGARASVVRFVVSDDTTRLTVADTDGVPALFRAGQGVVVEGFLGRDGAFHADTVLVKHNGVYRPPAPGETPHSADVSGA
jgi:cytochrome c-type biogenesis protein CcmE